MASLTVNWQEKSQQQHSDVIKKGRVKKIGSILHLFGVGLLGQEYENGSVSCTDFCSFSHSYKLPQTSKRSRNALVIFSLHSNSVISE